MLIQGDLQVARRSSAGLAINVPAWQSGKDYLINDMFIFGGDLYFVIANHTSTSVAADASSLNRVDLTNDVVYQAGAAVPAVTKINSYNTAASIGAAPTVVPASTYSTYERDSGRLRVYIADSLGTAWQEVADTLIIVARLNSTQTSLAPGVYDLDSSGGVFDLTLQDTVGMWEFHNTNMSLGTNVVTLLSGGSKTFTDVSGAQVASDFVLNTSGLPVKVLHTELGNDYRVSIQRGDVANDRVFIPDSAVAPAIAGDPTALEVAAWGPTTTDTVAYYTGTDAAADPVIAVYHFDAAGAVTKIGNLVRLRSPDTNTYTESVNGQINFVVDGNPVGNVVWDTGLNMPKWTLLGGLDPSYFALTAVSTVQRDALVATSPLTKIGWLVLHDNGLVKTHQWWDGAAWKDFGGTASDRLFLASSVVAPASPNNPTLSEIATAVGTSRNVIAYFTGSDTSTDAVSHAYHVDNSGNVTLLEKPSSSSWILQGSPVSLTANQNYIFLADGNYPLPAGAAAGDTVSVIASSGAVTLTATGVFFSGPGQLVTNPGDQLALPAYVRFDLFNVGGGNWAVIKAFDSRLAVADLTADGVLGSLDKLLANVWILGQTTAGVIATLPVSSALATSILTIINGGTVPITIEGSSVNVGDIRRFYWDGTAWLVEPAPVVIPAFLPWAAATVFTADQYVEYLGEIYRCLSDHTSSASFFADMTGGGYWSHVSTDRDYVGQILDATTSEPVAPSAGLFILHSGVDGLGSVSGFSFAGGNVYVGDGTTWQGVSSIDGMRFYDILSSRTYVVRSGTWSPLVTRHIVQSIVDFTAAEPPAPQAGQWFIHSGVTGVGSVSTTVTFNSQSLYGYNGSNFFELIPIDGEEAYNRADNASYTFNGGTWLPPADPGTVWQFTTGATLVLAGEAWVVNSGHTVTLPTSPTAGDSILFAPGNGDWNTLNATFTAPGATTVGAGQAAMPTGSDVMTFVYDALTDNWYVFAGDSPALELYRGEIVTTVALTALASANLVDGMAYTVGVAMYYWSSTATTGALEPDDKVGPGVNPGYWVRISSPPVDTIQDLTLATTTAWDLNLGATANLEVTNAVAGAITLSNPINGVDGQQTSLRVSNSDVVSRDITFSAGYIGSAGPAIGTITLSAGETRTYQFHSYGDGVARLSYVASSTAVATLIDSSLAVQTVTLPAATGSGDIRYYANKSIVLTATLAVQAGEYLNGILNGTFLFSNYGDGAEFEVVDYATGKWQVSVIGTTSVSALAKFVARKQGAVQSIPNGIDTLVTFPGVDTNDEGGFSTGTSLFTAPRDGFYQFNAAVRMEYNTSPMPQEAFIALRINTTDERARGAFSFIGTSGNATSYYYANVSVSVQMAAGDTMSLYCRQDTGAAHNLNGASGINYFTGSQQANSEVVLAGMVPVESLDHLFLYEGQNLSDIQTLSIAVSQSGPDTLAAVGSRLDLSTPDSSDALGITVSGATATIAKAGRYMVDASINCYYSVGVTTRYWWQLVKNGTTILATTSVSDADVVVSNSHNIVWSGTLAATDTLDLRAGVQGAGSVTITNYSLRVEQQPSKSVVLESALPVLTVVTTSSNYTASASDYGKYIRLQSTAVPTLFSPSAADVGKQIVFRADRATQMTILAGGSTVNGSLVCGSQECVAVVCVGAGTWDAIGGI